MLDVSMEQAYRVLVKWTERTEIIISLIGVGGTGSALAIDLARLCYHARQMGQDVRLQLIDGDAVEESNVGRQQFSEWEIGCNKAESMAERLSMWLGVPVMGTGEYLKQRGEWPLWKESYYHRPNRIIVGAVDNYRARRAIARIAKDLRCWWIDAGNDDASGQVLVGNCHESESVVIDHQFALVAGLPGPAMQMPALLEKPIARPATDCAMGMVTGEQGLFVNRLMATWAARAVEDLVLRQQIDYMAVYASLIPPAAESRMATWTRLQKFENQLQFKEKVYEE